MMSDLYQTLPTVMDDDVYERLAWLIKIYFNLFAPVKQLLKRYTMTKIMVDKRICTKVNNIGTFAFKSEISPFGE